MWQFVALDDTATFEMLAMDNKLRNMILDDLDMFLELKELYKSVGKSWKRGYLLYGPPRCDKSSLIVVVASYITFDVHDLELGDVLQNTELRSLLMPTRNRSIFVVEDIDYTLELHNRLAFTVPLCLADKPPVTLSRFLNFIDGLWSSCGEERIIVFTANHINKLDTALLRPGCMDLHISLSYCNACVFRELASLKRIWPFIKFLQGSLSILIVTTTKLKVIKFHLHLNMVSFKTGFPVLGTKLGITQFNHVLDTCYSADWTQLLCKVKQNLSCKSMSLFA
ncbi:hypothetical protein RYX36_022707 [Vicia faba]